MKLTYFEGDEPNFGDELNAFMWDSLLPEGFLDEDDSELFLGIGSILWDYLPSAPLKHVIGSGYGGYTNPPDVSSADWNIVWVRGPITAEKLKIDPSLAITNSAILLRAIDLPQPATGVGTAFMPHFQSVHRGNWAEACALAGITYLDPRDDPVSLIARIRGADLLLTEAMHGAIVADAMRTPFVPITPNHPEHRAKWIDWSRSMQIDLRPAEMQPSSLRELYVRLTGLQGQGARSRALLDHRMLAPLQRRVVQRAASWLAELARKVNPQMSGDSAVEAATERSLEALDHFVTAKGGRPLAR